MRTHITQVCETTKTFLAWESESKQKAKSLQTTRLFARGPTADAEETTQTAIQEHKRGGDVEKDNG